MRAKEVNGERPTALPRLVLRLSAGILFGSLLLTAGAAVAASEGAFEIVISIETVVRAPEDSETVLRAHPVPSGLVGETCSVIAQSLNQSSVHPGNDLIVESQTRILLSDVEAEPGGVVTAKDVMVLGDQILIILVMGPDEIFSAGIEVLFDCPPEPTTTTSPTMSTTTTVAVSTTTTLGESTTTIDAVSTTTSPGSTSTTTVPKVTTTTIEDQELARTGSLIGRLALMAVAIITSGVLLLVGERTEAIAGVGSLSFYRRRCKNCHREAEFMTPHGRLCMTHTRMALDGDEELWMPSKLKRRSQH
ncbi:MAG: hypothetical protein IH943_07195 [Acidobacteria bacterium]|nr:hypothetical protein [Acidobacteriota bacterium]